MYAALRSANGSATGTAAASNKRGGASVNGMSVAGTTNYGGPSSTVHAAAASRRLSHRATMAAMYASNGTPARTNAGMCATNPPPSHHPSHANRASLLTSHAVHGPSGVMLGGGVMGGSNVTTTTYAAASTHMPAHRRHVSTASLSTPPTHDARYSFSTNNNNMNNNSALMSPGWDRYGATMPAGPVTSEEHLQLLCIFLFPEHYHDHRAASGRHAFVRIPDSRNGMMNDTDGNNGKNNANNTNNANNNNNYNGLSGSASRARRSSLGAKAASVSLRGRAAAASERDKLGHAAGNGGVSPDDGRAAMTLGGHVYQPPSPLMLSTRGRHAVRRGGPGRGNGTW